MQYVLKSSILSLISQSRTWISSPLFSGFWPKRIVVIAAFNAILPTTSSRSFEVAVNFPGFIDRCTNTSRDMSSPRAGRGTADIMGDGNVFLCLTRIKRVKRPGTLTKRWRTQRVRKDLGLAGLYGTRNIDNEDMRCIHKLNATEAQAIRVRITVAAKALMH